MKTARTKSNIGETKAASKATTNDAVLASEAAASLVRGLRSLRNEGLLCNAALTVDGDRVHAHQAVLAAASVPLRNYFASGGNADKTAAVVGAPAPVELKLQGAGGVEAVQAMVEHVYGNGAKVSISEEAGKDLRNLAGAFAFPTKPPLTANTIAAGLRELRAKGTLCDIVLIAAGKRFPAHQAVLAASSLPLHRYIVDGVNEHTGCKAQELTSGNIELELQGVSNPEALRAAIDHLYGVPGTVALRDPALASAHDDLQRLSTAFGLPDLEPPQPLAPRPSGAAAASITKEAPLVEKETTKVGKCSSSTPSSPSGGNPKVVIAQPKFVDAQAAALAAFAKVKKARTPEKQTEPAAASESEMQQDDSPAAAASASEANDSQQEEVQRYTGEYRQMSCVAFNCAKSAVPESRLGEEDPALQGLEHTEASAFNTLLDIFFQRPVWLDGLLFKQMPEYIPYETMMKFLPYVAYQWTDGPWGKAYARLGWDPRDNADEAAALQVVTFKDPYFRQIVPGHVRILTDDNQERDWHFKRPPNLKAQLYQLIDIKDDYIESLTKNVETETECSRLFGWWPEFIFEAVKGRMLSKCSQMREKMAMQAKREEAAAKKRKEEAALARAALKRKGKSCSGKVAKRVRVSGG